MLMFEYTDFIFRSQGITNMSVHFFFLAPFLFNLLYLGIFGNRTKKTTRDVTELETTIGKR